MKIIADTHCHTLASTHAYSTVAEMADAAAKAGLYAIALTDHGPQMPGAPGRWYFHNLVAIPRRLSGVLILRGAEANVVSAAGELDVSPDDIGRLDWIVASMHGVTMRDGPLTAEECTEAWLRVAENPAVRVIGHSGSPQFAYDYERVIPEFGRRGKLVEINENSFLMRKSSVPNCVKIANLCKKRGVPVVVNSDAHFHTMLGSYGHALRMLREIDFPEELVVNSNVERFRQYLKEYTSVLSEDGSES